MTVVSTHSRLTVIELYSSYLKSISSAKSVSVIITVGNLQLLLSVSVNPRSSQPSTADLIAHDEREWS